MQLDKKSLWTLLLIWLDGNDFVIGNKNAHQGETLDQPPNGKLDYILLLNHLLYILFNCLYFQLNKSHPDNDSNNSISAKK